MAKFSVVDYLTGPLGPSADVNRPDVPATTAGPPSPLTLLLQGAGVLTDALPSAQPAAPAAPPPPPVNADPLGRVLTSGAAAAPGAASLPPGALERGMAIFRLFADKAFRENTLAGAAVSNVESGRTTGPAALAETKPAMMGLPVRDRMLVERQFRGDPNDPFNTPPALQATPEGERLRRLYGDSLWSEMPPDMQRQTLDQYLTNRDAYEANRAEKEAQTRALGPMSGVDEATALLSSLFGSVLSPESLVGPTKAALTGASTAGKAVRYAGANAGIVGTTEPLAQTSAVARGDRPAYSPKEHALATAGAAALGAIIPGLGALMRRFGAVSDAPPPRDAAGAPPDTGPPGLDGEIIQPAPPGTPRLPAPEAGPPARAYEPPDTRVTLNPDVPKELPAPRAAPEPTAEPRQAVTQPAIEGPRAQSEVRQEPDGTLVIRIAPERKPEVAEAAPEAAPVKNVGDPPKQGLAVAAKMPDGMIVYGKPGQVHAELTTAGAPLHKNPEVELGWAGSDGRFLTKEQALASLPADHPVRSAAVASQRGRLDSVELAQSRLSPPSRQSLDNQDVPGDGRGMQPTRAADDPLAIPEFMRRPLPGKAEPKAESVEPVMAPEPAKEAEPHLNQSVVENLVKGYKDDPARLQRQLDIARKTHADFESGTVKEVGGSTRIRRRNDIAQMEEALKRIGGEDAPTPKVETPAPAAAKPSKPRITRGLANKPIAEQAAHHRAVNPKKYRQDGPATEKALAEYFTPGRVIPSYGGGRDRVVGFEWNGGQWRARVRAVESKTGEPVPRDMERVHSTRPTWQDIDRALNDPLNAAKAEPPRAAEPAPKDDVTGNVKQPDVSGNAPKPKHPYEGEFKDTIVEMNANFSSAAAKAAGPEMIGAVVGGGWDHYERYGTPGMTWRGALAGALAIAATRHRIPGLAKPVFGKQSFAKDALGLAGKAVGSTKLGRWFHPTMGLPRDLWDRIKIQTGVETQNAREDILKLGKHIRENFTDAERVMMSDWIERRNLGEHGVTSWGDATTRVRDMADDLTARTDAMGEQLVELKMLDETAYKTLKGEYLHRYYLDKQAADHGFREAAKRAQATATYAMRRGEAKEFANDAGFAVGDTAVQWTHAGTGNVRYRKPGRAMGDEWFASKEFKVEKLSGNGKTAFAHRDYTPAEREAMGEIRDANYRFVMGMHEAARDVALGRMFRDIANDPKWASAVDKPGWKYVEPTKVVGTKVKKWGELGGKWVDPQVWSAMDVIRKPWTNFENETLNNISNGYLKALGMWKVGKTAYNPATHFNNVMGNVSLSLLTGEATPAYVIRAIGALRKGGALVDEAKRAGLSLGREANLGDVMDSVKLDVGLATGNDTRGGWLKFADWYTNNAIVRAYQHEDSAFKLAAYMKNRDAGMAPREAVAKAHEVFFDYSDVPLGVQLARDTYSPFITYTYKYGQVALKTLVERPWAFLAAFGILSGMNMMSYNQLYAEREKPNEEYEREFLPKWLQGASGFGAPKAIRIGRNEKDTKTGEDRGLFLNTRYFVPGGDLLDFTANGNFGPSVWPQVFGNTILGGNPLINFAVGLANGKDTFFDKPIKPYADTGMFDVGKRPTKEVLANWGALARFAAFMALPPLLTTIPDKLGNAAVSEGALPKGGQMAEFFGWTGTDFAGRQRSIERAILSSVGIKIEDVNFAEQQKFRESELVKEARESLRVGRNINRNQSMTEARKEGARESFADRVKRLQTESKKMRDLREKAGR